MQILDYFTCGQPEYWLEQIGCSDWSAGQCLHGLLAGGSFHDVLGEDSRVLLLADGDKLASFCTYSRQDDIQSTELGPWIGFVYTFPEYRSRRLSGMLIQKAEKIARAEHAEFIFISTGHKGLYEKYGYEFFRMMYDINGEPSRVYRKHMERVAIRRAERADADVVLCIVQRAVSCIYPRYYPASVVSFFLNHHSKESVLADCLSGRTYLLEADGVPAGTVTIAGNAAVRLFVLPECQSRGYGSLLMDFAEAKISRSFRCIHVDASLAAKELYLKRGYKETKTCRIQTDSGDFLVYDEMEKCAPSAVHGES